MSERVQAILERFDAIILVLDVLLDEGDLQSARLQLPSIDEQMRKIRTEELAALSDAERHIVIDYFTQHLMERYSKVTAWVGNNFPNLGDLVL